MSNRGLGTAWIAGCLMLLLVGCGGGEDPAGAGPPPTAPSGTVETAAPAPVRRPSILLLVLDTTRADAVSAYGKVRDTTPIIDAVAKEGVLYRNAYANASWTLPSHASLFTGLWPSAHGTGWRRTHLPDGVETIAERLAAAGYETVGVAENPWLSPSFNMTQGFERFSQTARTGDGTLQAVDEWLAERDAARPFFLFVNVLDSHNPYRVRSGASFLPPGVTAKAAKAVPQRAVDYMCRWRPDSESARILKGMYLGGVAAAGRKVGAVLSKVRRSASGENVIVVVTADHGEHFGEHGLAQHAVGLHLPLLHVPLVVQGLPGTSPAVVDTPVQLVDVVPSILSWTGLAMPAGLSGRPLPLVDAAAEPARSIVAEWHDPAEGDHEGEGTMAGMLRLYQAYAREKCTPADPVYGTMRALIRGRKMLLWYERFPASLYDLASDPDEEHDIAPSHPDEVAALVEELRGLLPAPVAPDEAAAPAPRIDEDVMRRLQQLGYAEKGEPHGE